MRRVLTDEQELALAKRYKSGEMFYDLAKSFGIGQQTVYNTLNKLNVSKNKHRKALVEKKIIRECSDGATIKEVATHFHVSTRTIKRILSAYRERGETLILKKGRPLLGRTPLPFRKRTEPLQHIDPALVEQIYAVLKHTAFPFPEHRDKNFITRELGRLQRFTAVPDGQGVIRPWSSYGARICLPYFPNRYRAARKGELSAYDGWHSAVMLKRAIRLQLRYGAPTEPARVLRAMTLACRTPSIFRPTIAKFVYRTFCPPGGRVWDPCSGYGGRLLGAHVAGVHYIGTDVEPETIEGNRLLAESLGASHELFVSPAENFDPPRVDLVFTSPPYFDRERYSNREEQTWKKHGSTLDQWLEGFLRPVIERARHALPDGGHLVLNIADLKRREGIIPLVACTIDIACRSNFAHVQTLLMPLAAINRVAPTEPVLVFRAC